MFSALDCRTQLGVPGESPVCYTGIMFSLPVSGKTGVSSETWNEASNVCVLMQTNTALKWILQVRLGLTWLKFSWVKIPNYLIPHQQLHHRMNLSHRCVRLQITITLHQTLHAKKKAHIVWKTFTDIKLRPVAIWTDRAGGRRRYCSNLICHG